MLKLKLFNELEAVVVILSALKNDSDKKGLMIVYRTVTFETLYECEVQHKAMKYPEYSDPFSEQGVKIDKWITDSNVFLTKNSFRVLIALTLLKDKVIFKQLKLSQTEWIEEHTKEINGQTEKFFE